MPMRPAREAAVFFPFMRRKRPLALRPARDLRLVEAIVSPLPNADRGDHVARRGLTNKEIAARVNLNPRSVQRIIKAQFTEHGQRAVRAPCPMRGQPNGSNSIFNVSDGESTFGEMLNEYHIKFLRHLHSEESRFLIVGGQARWIYCNHPTRDLDIWGDVSGTSRSKLEERLNAWRSIYRIHFSSRIPDPIVLRPNLQIQIPDDVCLYRRESDGGIEALQFEDRIDFLTSIGDLNFEQCYERSRKHVIDGKEFHLLSPEDLEGSEQARWR